jgi:hypothetical protein
MVTSLAIKLCETSDTWRRFVGPVVEMVAGELWRSVRSRISKTDRPLPTRLTQDHRREVKGSVVPAVAIPQPAHVCRDCGASLRRDRTRCSRCSKPLTRGNLLVGRKIAQSPNALTKRSVTMRQHKAAISNWTADLPASLTRDVYLNRIVPALAHVSLSRIRSTLGISEPYARWIKNGKRIPHARHWQALARLARITA